MPARILRLFRVLVDAPDSDTLLNSLHAIASPLRLICIWPISPGESFIRFDDVLYHRDVPKKFRDESKAITAQRGLSPMAQHALTDPNPFTISELKKTLQLPKNSRDHWAFDFLWEHGIPDALYVPHGNWMAFFAADHVFKRAEVSRDTRYVIHMAFDAVILRLKEMAKRRAKTRPTVELSQRELVVLRHLSLGESNAKVAENLAVSVSTVKSYLSRAQKKLGADNPTHAVAIAVRKRLI